MVPGQGIEPCSSECGTDVVTRRQARHERVAARGVEPAYAELMRLRRLRACSSRSGGGSAPSTGGTLHIVKKRSTKLVGDIAVQHVVLAALERGWCVATPVGDRMPYVLIVDVRGRLHRLQVKSAFHLTREGCWVASVRRSKTNRRAYRFEHYGSNDFDFAVIWHPADRDFFVIPIREFLRWRGSHVILSHRGRAGRFRNAWQLIG